MKKDVVPRPAPSPLKSFGTSLVLSAIAFALLLMGDRGTEAWKKAQADSRTLKARIAELETGNVAIQKRIADAETSTFELEKDARERMGLLKPDEIVFLLPDKARNAARHPNP